MPHAIWKGSISLGLVNIPIILHVATRDRLIEFHNLHDNCHTPLESKRWCPYHKAEVPWSEVVKGYKVTRNKYVVLTKKELESVQLKSTKTVEISKFVDLSQIDPILVEKNYYIVPQEGGERAYALFRDILGATGKAAVGKIVIRTKEHVVAIRHYRQGMIMTVLHYADEVMPLEGVEDVPVKDAELKLAKVLVDSLAGEFDIGEYSDEYRNALEGVIKKKLEGRPIKAMQVKVAPTPSKELMESLKASVQTVKRRKE